MKHLYERFIANIADRLYERNRSYLYARVKAEREKLEVMHQEQQKELRNLLLSISEQFSEDRTELENDIRTNLYLWWESEKKALLKQVEEYVNGQRPR